MKSKTWLIIFLILFIFWLVFTACTVISADPYFHYHAPDERYYYDLNIQRSQNNGILKHFNYDGIIIGTSMIENFLTSEAEDVFGGDFVKAPFQGGTFKEIDDNIEVALEYHPETKIVIRALDPIMFFRDKDSMRDDLGKFPYYLYDNNFFNDFNYLLNKEVLDKCFEMQDMASFGRKPGVKSFDVYSYWMPGAVFGKNEVLKDRTSFKTANVQASLTDEEAESIIASAVQNITELPARYPDTEFYYFIPPYSAAYFGELLENGEFERFMAAERLYIEEILKCPEIRLFSFNNFTDITTDLNNYKDTTHYSEDINSLILKYMKEGTGLLTLDNCEEYFEKERDFYLNFDYNSLFMQEDREDAPCKLHAEFEKAA